MKKYRFFYHYNRRHDKMSVHFRDKCIICENVACLVNTETKRNKKQPHVVVRGFCENVIQNLEGDVTIL
jgi:hypothetical protein